jgi:hypothetical protein
VKEKEEKTKDKGAIEIKRVKYCNVEGAIIKPPGARVFEE